MFKITLTFQNNEVISTKTFTIKDVSYGSEFYLANPDPDHDPYLTRIIMNTTTAYDLFLDQLGSTFDDFVKCGSTYGIKYTYAYDALSNGKDNLVNAIKSAGYENISFFMYSYFYYAYLLMPHGAGTAAFMLIIITTANTITKSAPLSAKNRNGALSVIMNTNTIGI